MILNHQGLGIATGALYGDSLAVFEPVHEPGPEVRGLGQGGPGRRILCVRAHAPFPRRDRRRRPGLSAPSGETIAEKKVVTYDLALPGYTLTPVPPSTCSAMAAEIARKVPLVDLDTPLPRPRGPALGVDPHLDS